MADNKESGSSVDAGELGFLVVDDSSTMRRIVSRCLKDIGAGRIVEACDGMEALGKLRAEGPFDVILTDWNMPVMNGMEFLKQVKADESLKDIPVVMVRLPETGIGKEAPTCEGQLVRFLVDDHCLAVAAEVTEL